MYPLTSHRQVQILISGAIHVFLPCWSITLVKGECTLGRFVICLALIIRSFNTAANISDAKPIGLMPSVTIIAVACKEFDISIVHSQRTAATYKYLYISVLYWL